MAETTEKLVKVADLVNFATINDTLYPRKAAVTAEIDEKVAAQVGSTYKAAGTVADVDSLPALTKANLGKVVNVSADFTTTEDFLEGAGKEIPAGSNVAVVESGTDTYAYDVLAGMVDLTAYAKTEAVTTELSKKIDKVEGMTLSSNDYTTAEKTKLAGMEIASTAEVKTAIETALGVTPEAGGEDTEQGDVTP